MYPYSQEATQMSVFNTPSWVGIFTSALLIYFLVGKGEMNAAVAADSLPLRLDERPFSPSLCKSTGDDRPISIHVRNHRDLVLNRVEGQYIPSDTNKARTKEYTHYVTLKDLTNGILKEGGIAFDRDHAVIFTPDRPKGIARTEFLASLPEHQQPVTERALATFLRLHPVFNAAIDTCRPYPPFVTYGTDDEIDRIEAGRRTFTHRVRAFNEDPAFMPSANIPEPGLEGGYVDPTGKRRTSVSYHALNPLNFYVP